ncbi:phytoene/squalene synthase family protein [Roseovarius gahaiensis]|uniref:Phytoene/squalene synthase family protein n=1 Tax=Roseovarius gahaiensis TaxID=2716691 RepID=A0A967BBK6_9RHOB|nr:phytoene/squalene synthase family protein [Roseovarius gahaiensis]NHQ74962.1 phytoene/squalene synthase family protein [Roseovarius gahaiensis]
MIAPQDMAHCEAAIRHGSLSFHAASRLLPAHVRNPALALYAFCRLADDAVDLQPEKASAVLRLHERLDLAYAGKPRNSPADRAFAAIIEDYDMPRALPEALLEGLAWDAMETRYATLSELRSYAARVASAVGVMMCVLMRVRDQNALARASDLGVAMQLTNIARDVGEDAREGRLYLPTDWMEEAGLAPEAFLESPRPTPVVAQLVKRLLHEADELYARSEAGIAALPLSCRPGIFAARYIYAGIGGQLRRAGCDSISARARTNGAQKIGWLCLSGLRAAGSVVMPTSPVIFAQPSPETAFLVEAAAEETVPVNDWSDTLYETMAGLKAQDAARNEALKQPAAEGSVTA